MSVKINLNQPQEKCLTDLFNATNEARLGIAISPEDIFIGLPTAVTGAVNTEVYIESRGLKGIVGATRLRYNRLRLQEAPLPESGVLVVVTADDRTTVDLCNRINKILKIELKETDIISEPINFKQLEYGVTDSQITVDENCLVFTGTLPIKLVREEPEALLRDKVVFDCWGEEEVINDPMGKTHSEQKYDWEISQMQGVTDAYVRVTTTLDQDPFAYKVAKNTTVSEDSPLAFWYKLYPEVKAEDGV